MKKLIFCLFLCLTAAANAGTHYIARDVGTLATDKSEARSLNEDGWVAGKYFHNNQVSDFLWTPESGLQVITNEADEEIFPRVNNLGNVVGCILKPGSWFSSSKVQSYTLNRKNGMKLHQPTSREDGFTICMNNAFLIVSNHIDVFQSTYSLIITDGQNNAIKFEPILRLMFYPAAINNQSQVLITGEGPGLFNTSFLASYQFGIFDVVTGEYTIITEDGLYYGCGINDNNLVIAKTKNGKEGFYGSKELGLISLGKFIPSALNNYGDIVGRRDKEALLRKSDGTMIDLNKEADLESLGIDQIVDVWAINDSGQILATARISGKTHAVLLEPQY